MKQFYDQCSEIIKLANQWINKCLEKNKTDEWINNNFAPMFIYLCIGNKPCSIKELFSDTKSIINNENIIYEIKDNKISIILFSSLSSNKMLRDKSKFLNSIFSELLQIDKKSMNSAILRNLLARTDVKNTNHKFEKRIKIEKRKFLIKTIIKELYQQ